nr:immunoglobulin light chain junction region [Macaca mulatta]
CQQYNGLPPWTF